MSLIEQLQEKQKQKHQQNVQWYRALLLSSVNREPTAREVDQLDQLTSQLGFNADKAHADLECLRQIAARQDEADAYDARYAEWHARKREESEHATKVAAEYDAALQKQEEYVKASGYARAMFDRAKQAREEIQALERKHKHLFAN